MNFKKIVILNFFMMLHAQSYLKASIAQQERLRSAEELLKDINQVQKKLENSSKVNLQKIPADQIKAWTEFNKNSRNCITLGLRAYQSTKEYERFQTKPSSPAKRTR